MRQVSYSVTKEPRATTRRNALKRLNNEPGLSAERTAPHYLASIRLALLFR